MIKTTTLLAILLFPGLAAAAPPKPGPVDQDWLRRQTVRLQVVRNGEEENGSGVILCQVDKQAYVLTANHVLFGKSRNGKSGSLLDVSRITLSFFKDAKPVEEIRSGDEEKNRPAFTVNQVPGKDLLLLSFEEPADLAAFAAPGKAPAQTDLAAGPAPRVQAVGYFQGKAESWAVLPGELRRRSDEYLYHSTQIREGFSGGPLFDEAGALIGINVQIAGEEKDGGGLEAYALPIDQVLAAVDKWVPATCLPRNDEESWRRAGDLYREAMRSVSLQDWTKAERQLREALEQRPFEGGSVHLQGMRYTEYLPHYHLGLALYHQDQDHYGEALRELAVSEVQGVVRANKRYKTLVKIRERCREKMKAKALNAK
jgi:S1-C subfamily serine protease